jgi:hypothetical protein
VRSTNTVLKMLKSVSKALVDPSPCDWPEYSAPPPGPGCRV